MAVVLPFLALASAGISAIGAISQGNAQAKAANYNAAVKTIQANQAVDQAGAQASNDAVKTRQKMAAVRAGSIQNGFEESGSVSDILDTVQRDGALESMTAMYDGTVRAQALRQGAELDKMTASNAKTAGYIGAGTSLLSGASKMYTGGRSQLDV